MTDQDKTTLNRRRLIKTLGGAGSGIILARTWERPLVHSVVLPVHAQLTGFNGSAQFGSGVLDLVMDEGGNRLMDMLVPAAHATTIVEYITVCITVVNLVATIEIYVCGNNGSATHKETNVDVSGALSNQEISYDIGYTGYGPSGSDVLYISGQIQASGNTFVFQGSVAHFGGSTPFTAVINGDCLPGCCFLAGTSVWMADGSYKAIENIVLGDMVMSHDFTNGRRIISPVTKLHRAAATDYLELNGLRVTGTHPFAIGEDQWQRAAELRPGAMVYGGTGPVTITTTENVHHAADVFNLHVAGTHNYFVGNTNQTYLVHNKA